VIRLALIVAAVSLTAGVLSAAAGAEEEIRGYIVVLRDEVKGPAEVASEHAARFNGNVDSIYQFAFKGYAAQFSAKDLEAVKRDQRVAYVEPDVPLELEAQTTPTGINRIFAASNSDLFINQVKDKWADVDVAVLDSGVDPAHPDLNVFRRVDCVGASMTCVDGAGDPFEYHGTAVAGVIGAIDNGIGVVGVAHGARIWSIKVFDPSSTVSDYFDGIDWIKAHADEIEVINSSVRAGGPSETFNNSQKELNKAGVIHIAAAGNQGTTVEYTPMVSDDVVTVSGIADFDGKPGGLAPPKCGEFDDRRYSSSNYGPKIDIAAPAVCISTTGAPGGGYVAPTGTSFAAPHVAGAAALLAMQKDPNSKADVDWIKKTLEEEGNFGWTDTSPDGIKEPLLDVGDSTVFDMTTAPRVETRGVSELQATSAVLHGMVNPRNLSTTYQFEYGTTTAYGTKVPASPKAMIGTVPADEPVSEPLTGLTAKTTFHYRVAATNAKGTTYSSDHTFTTPRPYVPRFAAEAYPATVSGAQVSGSPLKFTFAGGTPVVCGAVTLGGQLTQANTQLAGSGSHTGCTQGESSTGVAMNSCSYVLGVANSGPPYVGSFGISCTTAGDGIQLLLSDGCVYKLSPQTVPGAVAYTVEGVAGEQVAKATVSAKSLAYAKTYCFFGGGSSSGTNAELSGEVRYTAANGKGEAIGVYLTGGAGTGLAVVGEGSAEPSKQPRFEAAAHPARVAGDQAAASPLAFKFADATPTVCGSGELEAQLSAPAAQLTSSAEHSRCVKGESAAVIDMKSCRYVFGLANSGPPYTGSFGVSCTTAGDAIEISEPGCLVKLAPQSKTGAVSYAVVGTGSDRFVRATVSTKSLTYTRSGPCLLLDGKSSGSNGELSGAVDLYGFG
jgi:subtilisin family serine protease